MISEEFYKLPVQKRKRILEEAAKLFAKQGFHKANVNKIAARAGISVGALYKYFDTKEDLFDAVFLEAAQIVSEVFEKATAGDGSTFDKLKRLFSAALLVARRRAPFVEVYMCLSSPGMERFAQKFAPALEEAGAEAYRQLLKEGIERGELRPDIDINNVAYLLDNTLMALYASLTNSFMRIHRNIMLGEPGKITRQWAEETAEKVLAIVFDGIRNR